MRSPSSARCGAATRSEARSRWNLRSSIPTVVLADLEALARFKITGLLPDIACPVMVITGAEDRYIDALCLERHYLRPVRYHELDNAGHLVMWE